MKYYKHLTIEELGSEQRKKNSLASLPYQATSAGNLARIQKKNYGIMTKATLHNTKAIMKYLEMNFPFEQIANAAHGVKTLYINDL